MCICIFDALCLIKVNGLSEREEDSSVLNSTEERGRRETWRQIEMKAEQTVTRMSSFPLSLCFSWCEKAFQIMMWIDVQQLSPLLGPVRHLTGHRWQHYDGLGIVIQDACHLFTSRPSLISHHRPYNLAGTPPTPPPTPPAARHAIQDNTIHYNSFFSPPSP